MDKIQDIVHKTSVNYRDEGNFNSNIKLDFPIIKKSQIKN